MQHRKAEVLIRPAGKRCFSLSPNTRMQPGIYFSFTRKVDASPRRTEQRLEESDRALAFERENLKALG